MVLWSFPSFLVHPASPLIMSPRSGKRGLEVKSLILPENSLVGLDFNFFLVPPVIQTAPTQLGLTCAEYPLCFELLTPFPHRPSQNIFQVLLPRELGGGAAIRAQSPGATLETSASWGDSLSPNLPTPMLPLASSCKLLTGH